MSDTKLYAQPPAIYSQSWSGTAGTCPILLITAPPKKLANILLA
jgi:hypothetical protein